MPTNGNAGAAWAAYAARAGLRVLVVMPVGRAGDHPRRVRRRRRGAALVDGLISDAGAAGRRGGRRERGGWFDVSTLKEPYRIEGKKTMGFEIAEQLGWRMPDVIVYPTGGGVGLIGIYKALRELRELGWVDGRRCRGWSRSSRPGARRSCARSRPAQRRAEPWPDARTVAFGITVPKALGDFLILDALYATRRHGGRGRRRRDAGRPGGSPGGSRACSSARGRGRRAGGAPAARDGWLGADDEVVRAQHRCRAELPGHGRGRRPDRRPRRPAAGSERQAREPLPPREWTT